MLVLAEVGLAFSERGNVSEVLIRRRAGVDEGGSP